MSVNLAVLCTLMCVGRTLTKSLKILALSYFKNLVFKNTLCLDIFDPFFIFCFICNL